MFLQSITTVIYTLLLFAFSISGVQLQFYCVHVKKTLDFDPILMYHFLRHGFLYFQKYFTCVVYGFFFFSLLTFIIVIVVFFDTLIVVIVTIIIFFIIVHLTAMESCFISLSVSVFNCNCLDVWLFWMNGA